MRTTPTRTSQSGFTMIELSIYTLIAVILGAVSLSFLLTSATLATKNSNLNRSHDDLRLAFDRMAHQVAAANNVATLINTAGTIVTSPVVTVTTPIPGTLTGPAAGFKFDQVVGAPYILLPPAGSDPLAAGTIPDTATTITVVYAKNPLTHVNHLTASAAADSVNILKEGYILLIPMADGTVIRWQISAVGARDSSSANWFKLPLTFSSAIGRTVSWGVNQPQLVKIVRNEAFLVIRVDAGTPKERCELRYYKDFEPMPTLSDTTKYVVLCDQIGIRTGEDTPFGILDFGGDKLVQSTLKVRERTNSQFGLGSDNEFYTYFQLLVNLPSRFRPRTNQ